LAAAAADAGEDGGTSTIWIDASRGRSIGIDVASVPAPEVATVFVKAPWRGQNALGSVPRAKYSVYTID
jgi:hypothetical protein